MRANMKFKINGNQFVNDYHIACNELTAGCIEVYDNGIMIDVIDYETAKLDASKIKIEEME
jgi:hypothetical protein